MEKFRNVLVSFFVILSVTTMVLVLAYVKTNLDKQPTPVTETTVVEINKVVQ